MTDKDLSEISSREEMKDFMDTLEIGVVYEVTAEGYTKQMELTDKQAGPLKTNLKGINTKCTTKMASPVSTNM